MLRVRMQRRKDRGLGMRIQRLRGSRAGIRGEDMRRGRYIDDKTRVFDGFRMKHQMIRWYQYSVVSTRGACDMVVESGCL
jgi:hypothetical protein